MTRVNLSLLLFVAIVLWLPGCGGRPRSDAVILNEQVIAGQEGTKVVGEIWVDNWFRLWVNGELLIEDSVAYSTERSFNAERVTFRARPPMTLAIELRDFKENDTGLEYIGSARQQIGDGGAIAQFRAADTGELLEVTDSAWRCRVIHRAPVDEACAKEREPRAGVPPCGAEISPAPAGWTAVGFDDSGWSPATEFLPRVVRPKDGYDAISWDESARLIWSEDLRRDNVVLCRSVIAGDGRPAAKPGI